MKERHQRAKVCRKLRKVDDTGEAAAGSDLIYFHTAGVMDHYVLQWDSMLKGPRGASFSKHMKCQMCWEL